LTFWPNFSIKLPTFGLVAKPTESSTKSRLAGKNGKPETGEIISMDAELAEVIAENNVGIKQLPQNEL